MPQVNNTDAFDLLALLPTPFVSTPPPTPETTKAPLVVTVSVSLVTSVSGTSVVVVGDFGGSDATTGVATVFL